MIEQDTRRGGRAYVNGPGPGHDDKTSTRLSAYLPPPGPVLTEKNKKKRMVTNETKYPGHE